ncbi:MAG: hypothetical protein LWX52_06980 [Deltaproteobacteria bacterium]|nr:hypothetical protein [Deltaproteobacteria bacterium]
MSVANHNLILLLKWTSMQGFTIGLIYATAAAPRCYRITCVNVDSSEALPL